jgi:hypothetical protein
MMPDTSVHQYSTHTFPNLVLQYASAMQEDGTLDGIGFREIDDAGGSIK